MQGSIHIHHHYHLLEEIWGKEVVLAKLSNKLQKPRKGLFDAGYLYCPHHPHVIQRNFFIYLIHIVQFTRPKELYEMDPENRIRMSIFTFEFWLFLSSLQTL